jgi:hypothetical protein
MKIIVLDEIYNFLVCTYILVLIMHYTTTPRLVMDDLTLKVDQRQMICR